MPSVLIEVRREYPIETEQGIMEAVHAALIDSFKIKPDDRNVRLVMHEPHRFQCPPGREKPEAYTHISIDCFAGRSLQAKRSLYTAIIDGLQTFGIPANHIKIMLREITPEYWGIRGGQAACDIDLGYKIDI